MSDSDETIGGRIRAPSADTYAALGELAETWSALAVERAEELDAVWGVNADLGNRLWMAGMERDRAEARLAHVKAELATANKEIADLTESLRRHKLAVDAMTRALTRHEEHIQKLEEMQPAASSVEILLPAGERDPATGD